MNHKLAVAGAFALLTLSPAAIAAGPNSLGSSGLVNMPDGRLADDGTLRGGVSYMSPYAAIYGGITLVPWLELSGRFTRIEGIPGFAGRPDLDYGDYKDKAFDFKLRLLEESDWLPALAFGRQDFHGTAVFAAKYLAASKLIETERFGTLDLTAGYGDGRFDGAFGGARWSTPWNPDVSVLVEYDGFDYEDDFYTRQSGMPIRDGGLTAGVGYQRGWFSGQLSRQDQEWGLNLAMTVPLQQRTFAPKTDEPPPVPMTIERPPTLAAWKSDTDAVRPLVEALSDEGFGSVRVLTGGDAVRVSYSTGRMSTIGRAAGRGARLVALHAPPEVRELELTITDRHLPLLTYRFADLDVVRRWLTGAASPEELTATISHSYASAVDARELQFTGIELDDVRERDGSWRFNHGPLFYGFPMRMSRNVANPVVLRVTPINFAFAFNDPNGVLKYELYARMTAFKWLTERLYLNVSTHLVLDETISETIGRSNSLLPHVRSDASRYLREGERLRLNTAYLGHLANPRERVYSWMAAGMLERMFAGVGGEVLYLPRTGNWAFDFSAYGVRQRDYEGRLGFLDYQTVTAIGSLHYRIPSHGVTLTARAGRFLARDNGVRFEVKRRFLSGFEVGAWYSHTDANDITSPGSPDDPYRDKGVFVRYSVGAFLPRDSNAATTVSLAPWARDPGQMVWAAGGLYEMYERGLLLNLEDFGPWSDFGQ